jgi:hypothetical protein
MSANDIATDQFKAYQPVQEFSAQRLWLPIGVVCSIVLGVIYAVFTIGSYVYKYDQAAEISSENARAILQLSKDSREWQHENALMFQEILSRLPDENGAP